MLQCNSPSVSLNEESLLSALDQKIKTLGFDYWAMLKATPSHSIQFYEEWIEQGYAGTMEYLERHASLKADVTHVHPETATILVLGMNYNMIAEKRAVLQKPDCGVISRYALADDYHEVIRNKLKKLQNFIVKDLGKSAQLRICVDSAPILEREYAQRSGMGWIGKNSLLIHGKKGSWFFLAELLMDCSFFSKEIPASIKIPGSCGSCTRCIEVCPTQAIVAEGVVDARRCISYLTIELKTAIPLEFRSKMGNLIFGCDLCQEVCPWNNKALISQEPAFKARSGFLEPQLLQWMQMNPEEFSKTFKKSPIKRAKRRGLLRNIAVALGNWGSPEAIPVLQNALQDPEVLIRIHAAWALGQIKSTQILSILKKAQVHEKDAEVQQEIKCALQFCQSRMNENS